jgi:hypothetical protein
LATVKKMPDFEPQPRTERCRNILRHWQTLRGDRLRPCRSEIDPANMVRDLPHIGLFEVHAPDLTYCRLAGTAYRFSLGFELTGKNVVHLYAQELHRTAGYRFYMIATQPALRPWKCPCGFH